MVEAGRKTVGMGEVGVLVEGRGLVREYPRGGGVVRVVDGVSLGVRRGETMGVVGESGSGKSTVARMMLRLLEPTAGEVRYGGEDLLRKSRREMRGMRRRMQVVFQDPYAALDPRMRVGEILAEPFAVHGVDVEAAGLGRAARREWVRERLREMLADVEMPEEAMGRFPHELSGGQRQRINIARALALRPEFLVLDEPVSALDVSVGAQVVNLLRALQRVHGLTYLFISHSMPLVRYLCDRVAVMEGGRVVEEGPVLQVCEAPREAYTQRLLRATPELPG